jgi:uncharacterized protein (TIGR04255 family)
MSVVSSAATLRQSLPGRGRVIYAKNPLIEVVGAIVFPPILSLIQEPPSAFQQGVADDYPLVEYTHTTATEAFAASEKAASPFVVRNYSFFSVDKAWRVSLESNLLALTTSKYTSWSEFKARFAVIVGTAIATYRIGLITRLGLRYRDVIDRDGLGLGSASWKELIRPEFFGTVDFFTEEFDRNPPISLSIQLAIPPGQVRIGVTTAINQERKTAALLIDTDCFAEETFPGDSETLMKRADELNQFTGRIFQACITDRLHYALEPTQG